MHSNRIPNLHIPLCERDKSYSASSSSSSSPEPIRHINQRVASGVHRKPWGTK